MIIALLDENNIAINTVNLSTVKDAKAFSYDAIALGTGRIGQKWDGSIWIDVPDNPSQSISVTSWQLRKALNALGLRSSIESSVATNANQDLIDGWEYSDTFHSDNPYISAIGSALGKTPADIYGIFLLARTL